MKCERVSVVDDVGAIPGFACRRFQQGSGGFEVAVFERFEGLLIIHRRILACGLLGALAFSGSVMGLCSALQPGLFLCAIDAALLEDFEFRCHTDLAVLSLLMAVASSSYTSKTVSSFVI